MNFDSIQVKLEADFTQGINQYNFLKQVNLEQTL